MTNHVHLLATPREEQSISRMMQDVGRRYVRYFNTVYRRTGTLWEGRYKSSMVDAESYFLHCQRYIELNPVRANMVTEPAEYRWSSYHSNGRGIESAMWTPHPLYLGLANTKDERLDAYQKLFRYQLDGEVVKTIRNAVNKGMALGSERFMEEIEQFTGRRVKPLKRGPKKRGGKD